MTTTTTAASTCTLARPWYRVHPTRRYAAMDRAGVTSARAWEAIGDRLRHQGHAEQGDRRTFTLDRAYDAYQRAGMGANEAHRLVQEW